MWRFSPRSKRRILLASLGLFAALLATGLLLQLGVIHVPAAPSAGSSHSEECHVATTPASSCSPATTASCIVHNESKVIVADCGGPPTSQYCIPVLNVCFPTPDLNPADWFGWIWCGISGLVISTIQNLIKVALAPVYALISLLQQGLAAVTRAIWNGIVSFFNLVLSTLNAGLQAFVNQAYQPISSAIVTFFADLTALVVAAMGALTGVFAWAGPLAPVVAMGTFVAILGAVLWATVQMVRLGVSAFKTAFNLL